MHASNFYFGPYNNLAVVETQDSNIGIISQRNYSTMINRASLELLWAIEPN